MLLQKQRQELSLHLCNHIFRKKAKGKGQKATGKNQERQSQKPWSRANCFKLETDNRELICARGQ
jgi:hypothetical protein